MPELFVTLTKETLESDSRELVRGTIENTQSALLDEIHRTTPPRTHAVDARTTPCWCAYMLWVV